MEALSSAVKELRTSNQQVFDRFEDIVNNATHNDCEDGVDIVQSEVSNLKQRISTIDESRKLHEEVIKTIRDQTSDVRQRLKELENRLELSGLNSRPTNIEPAGIGDDTDKLTTDSKIDEARRNVIPFVSTTRDEAAGNRFRHHREAKQILSGPDDQVSHRTLATRSPNVVKQRTERVDNGITYWTKLTSLILEQGRELFLHLRGVLTVICLDISESMTEGNAWNEALQFLDDYLTGLEKMASTHGLTNEYVALVTFGHETKIPAPFTNKFKDIKHVVNNLQLGGPSPLFGGLILSAGVTTFSAHQIHQTPNKMNVNSKIVLITDGRPTENSLIGGSDVADPSKMDETKASILQAFGELRCDVVCIPVGNAVDMEFIKLMVDMTTARLFDCGSGERLSRSYFLHTRLIDPLGLFSTEPLTFGDGSEFSTQDKEDMKFFQNWNKEHLAQTQVVHTEIYWEGQSDVLPAIGSRVRRGPDWIWKEQDGRGPGTVVGHSRNDDHVWVHWDVNGSTNVYDYSQGSYVVVVVNEPRQLKPGQMMAVGCIVKPGRDWKDPYRTYNEGVVVEILRNDKAVVRWKNGDRNAYTFKQGDGMEIVVIPPTV